MIKKHFKGFLEFLRERGVMGLAIGFVIGGSVTKVVTSLVQDIINPLIGFAMGAASGLSNEYILLGTSKVKWGSFVSVLIDFFILSFVVYVTFKLLGLEKLDKKKDEQTKKK